MNTEVIKKLIEEKGISQSELASAIGVSEAFVTNMLRGYKMPSVATLKQMADYLSVTVDELLN